MVSKFGGCRGILFGAVVLPLGAVESFSRPASSARNPDQYFLRNSISRSVVRWFDSTQQHNLASFSETASAIAADCCRCNEPATTSSRNCSRVVDAAISRQCWLLVPTTSTGIAQPHRIPQLRRSFGTLRPQQPRKTGLRRSTIEVMPSCASADPEMRASVNASSSSCDSRCAGPARRNKRLISP
jgi:hypothetical protein